MAYTSPSTPARRPRPAPEREALSSWLDFHRAALLEKVDGLDDEQAGRRLVPSLTSLHGLVRHLTKVEHIWFVTRLAVSDDPVPFGWPQVKDGDFRLDGSEGLAADVDRYLAACARSREIFAGLSLDDVRSNDKGQQFDVRWVMLHVISEYAQHTGHADILRELIDAGAEG